MAFIFSVQAIIFKRQGMFTTMYMSKSHTNCTIGNILCLHHITGTAFITRLKLYVYVAEDTDTFQNNLYIIVYSLSEPMLFH